MVGTTWKEGRKRRERKSNRSIRVAEIVKNVK